MAQSYYMLTNYIDNHVMHTFSALLAIRYRNLILSIMQQCNPHITTYTTYIAELLL